MTILRPCYKRRLPRLRRHESATRLPGRALDLDERGTVSPLSEDRNNYDRSELGQVCHAAYMSLPREVPPAGAGQALISQAAARAVGAPQMPVHHAEPPVLVLDAAIYTTADVLLHGRRSVDTEDW